MPSTNATTSAPTASTSAACEEMCRSEKTRRALVRARLPLAILGIVAVIAVLDDSRAFLPGALVALFGEALQVWSSSHVKRKVRKLTTSGPYARVRNPMYIGRFFLILGFFVMTGTWWLPAIFTVAFAAYAHVRVKREEKFLEGCFGQPYRDYCAHVRSWLPNPLPWSGAERARGSWEQVKVNNEHLNLYILLVLLVVIAARIRFLPQIGF